MRKIVITHLDKGLECVGLWLSIRLQSDLQTERNERNSRSTEYLSCCASVAKLQQSR